MLLTSSHQNLLQISRPTSILSATHTSLISPTLNNLNFPIVENFSNSSNLSSTSNLKLLNDEISEQDNFSQSNESESREGCASVISFTSSNDKEDINNKFSSSLILSPMSMSQIKLNKNKNIIRQARSPNNTFNLNSSSSIPKSLHTSQKKHQSAIKNSSSILFNESNNKHLIKQQLRSKSCSVSKTLIEQQNDSSKQTILSTVLFFLINYNLKTKKNLFLGS